MVGSVPVGAGGSRHVPSPLVFRVPRQRGGNPCGSGKLQGDLEGRKKPPRPDFGRNVWPGLKSGRRRGRGARGSPPCTPNAETSGAFRKKVGLAKILFTLPGGVP